MNNIGFSPLNINSEQDLNLILRKFPEIETDKWDKSVSSLYKEIENGECVLGIENEKLHRRVEVVAVKCFHTDKEGQRFQIFEEKQVFKNGKERQRDFDYVAEKLQPGESPEACAIRGLAEELHITGQDVHVTPLENKFKRLESPTYKGIECSYSTHVFSCEIPDNLYQDVYVEEQQDKSTFFAWKKI